MVLKVISRTKIGISFNAHTNSNTGDRARSRKDHTLTNRKKIELISEQYFEYLKKIKISKLIRGESSNTK